MAVRLFVRTEQSFGRKLPPVVLFQHGTIRYLTQCVEVTGPRTDVALRQKGDGRNLLQMPSIGGRCSTLKG